MHASDQQLRPIRDRGRDILDGSMQVGGWETAVMHRTHHGECCQSVGSRVTSTTP
jgi:hypothetical protein